MDVRKLALLKALDDAARQQFSDALLAWQKAERERPAEEPRRNPPPPYIETRTALERVACDLGLTLNDVVNAVLGRPLRRVIEVTSESIVEKVPADIVTLVRTIESTWPADEPEFIAPPTEPKPVKPIEVVSESTDTTSTVAPKVGAKRGRKTVSGASSTEPTGGSDER